MAAWCLFGAHTTYPTSAEVPLLPTNADSWAQLVHNTSCFTCLTLIGVPVWQQRRAWSFTVRSAAAKDGESESIIPGRAFQQREREGAGGGVQREREKWVSKRSDEGCALTEERGDGWQRDDVESWQKPLPIRYGTCWIHWKENKNLLHIFFLSEMSGAHN